MTLKQHGHRIGPTRGIVSTVNAKGVPYHRSDVERWIRLNRVVFKTEKIDLLINADTVDDVARYCEYAATLESFISVRSDCASPIPDLRSFKEEGVLDLNLTPTNQTLAQLDGWLDAARNADLPVRLQIPIPFPDDFEAAALAEHYAQHGVHAVSVTGHDPLLPKMSTGSPDETTRSYEIMGALVEALEARDVECSLLHIPFCALDESLWQNVLNEPQFFADHQLYARESWDILLQLHNKGPVIAKKALLIWLGRYTLMANPIDDKLLPWLLEHPWLRARVIAWHRLTRHLRLSRSVPKAHDIQSDEDALAAVSERDSHSDETLGRACSACRLKRICNHHNHPGAKALNGFLPVIIQGEVVTYPMQFALHQPKFYDAIDTRRSELPSKMISLAAKANDILENSPPTVEVDSFDYEVDGEWCHQLPGGVRWYGLSNTEKISTPLGTLDPPFTISYKAGGGIAEYIGFSLGRDCKLVCPMEAYQHTITLHVDRSGSYVLLRDGRPVRPMQFEGNYYAPTRLGSNLQPRISIWNIDESLVTQNVKIWSDTAVKTDDSKEIDFTIVTVCVRYARRLQLALQSIAHQQGFDLSRVEIIIAYLPDVDSTEDILESFAMANPELTIHRSTFAEDKAQAKGFIINECLEKARGEWVMLLDADTMIPPDMLVKVMAQAEGQNFIVPDGRKLLSPEVTSDVLLGNRRPWEEWDALLGTDGEFRNREMGGTPIGFCQIVRRSCFDKVKYYEVDHFEGADWQFSIHMREEFGDELRLSGVPVLHLDHGGSKWYGTSRHF